MVAGGQLVIETTSWESEWRLWPLGDIHWGAAGCDEECVAATVGKIKRSSLSRWIGMGDYIDLISMRDERRFDPEMVAGKHRAAYFKAYGPQMRDFAISQFEPIAGKCIGMLQGNHEWYYSNRFEHALAQNIAEALGAPFLGYSCFRDVVFVHTETGERQRFRIYAHHGAGYAQTKGGKLNRLERFMVAFEADIYIIGHIHERLDDEIVILKANDDCTDIVDDTRVGVVSGTFLRTYTARSDGASGYGERKGYRPTPLGCPCIKIVPATRRLSIEKP